MSATTRQPSLRNDVQIRWMVRRDLPEVMEIEQLSFEFPWTRDELLDALRTRYCIGMVAETKEQVVGFMVYNLLSQNIHVLNLAVHPAFRRRGVGRAMEAKLYTKIAQQKRERMIADVRDCNEIGQQFFYACGWQVWKVLREHYRNNEDAYRFERFHLGS